MIKNEILVEETIGGKMAKNCVYIYGGYGLTSVKCQNMVQRLEACGKFEFQALSPNERKESVRCSICYMARWRN